MKSAQRYPSVSHGTHTPRLLGPLLVRPITNSTSSTFLIFILCHHHQGRGNNNKTVFKIKELHAWCFGIFFLPSPPFCSLFPGFYSAKADMVIYCGHPSLVLIHHRPVARRSWQQLFAFEFNRGAVSQRRQVKSITNTLLSHRIINQRQER